ncbi:HET-domain-containing protein [Macroventuria anomochaeta]|uniref:HET-domain-containing protein n=1 Tax=Macroventuria anomochaeta TaxID=301207 RepID=A0ACB6SAE0_9PLEO|nr:HET-domain-containing protein [Macroventuria anomochaeta]KAF2631024.1 HET-domain-containing protein [Macroventuria anomochaeta]
MVATSTVDIKSAHTPSPQSQGAQDATIKDDTIKTPLSSSVGPRLFTAGSRDPQFKIEAMLSVLHHARVKDLYRLDFKMRYDRTRCKRTFILQKNASSDPPFRTQLSHNTSSDEVYTLVLNWMARCTRECKSHCRYVGQEAPRWYPARLISLKQLKKADLFNSNAKDKSTEAPDVKVNLVETKEWPNQRPSDNVRYVTLSHCWGQGVTDQHKLTSRNIDTLKEGIRLSDLPQTFQDVITFSARLPRVGYIWIDSLCIKQGPDEQDDWLKQSASMDRVYSETFLNISATHASDSQKGLFRPRIPELLLEDEITLNIEGLPGAHPPPPENVVRTAAPHSLSMGQKIIHLLGVRWLFRYVFILLQSLRGRLGVLLSLVQRFSVRTKARAQAGSHNEVGAPHRSTLGAGISALRRSSTKVGVLNALKRSGTGISDDSDTTTPKAEAERHNLKRCTILDASFWSNRVDNAPVNRRGWVLQERLLSPRVLHFCHDQVAWECCGFDAAEGLPEGMPNFQLTSGGIIEESRLKGLDIKDGARLRNIRLNDYKEPDPQLRPEIYALELWRRIVEVYTRTAITNSEDKLIALSGMAKLMDEKMGSKDASFKYAAGLWNVHIESQLLWQVEPVWREVDETFDNVSTSPATYRAPSWSWASVDAHRDHGITYGDITDKDLYIKVEKVSINPRTMDNVFGIVESARTYIDMWCKLRRAVLYRKNPISKGRFGWRLVDRKGLDTKEHTNVYLDCPSDNAHNNMFGTDHEISRVFVIPAAKGPRIASEESKYLTCLLVQWLPGHEAGAAVFRRIGITKLSPWADSEALARRKDEQGKLVGDFKILEMLESDVNMPYENYDPVNGKHMIRLI